MMINNNNNIKKNKKMFFSINKKVFKKMQIINKIQIKILKLN